MTIIRIKSHLSNICMTKLSYCWLTFVLWIKGISKKGLVKELSNSEKGRAGASQIWHVLVLRIGRRLKRLKMAKSIPQFIPFWKYARFWRFHFLISLSSDQITPNGLVYGLLRKMSAGLFRCSPKLANQAGFSESVLSLSKHGNSDRKEL